MKTLTDIMKNILEHRKDLENQYSIKSLSVFGSVARGDNKDVSDVDIVVDFLELPGYFGFVRANRYIEELLGCKVDLVEKNGIRYEMKDRILKEAVQVW